MEAYYWDECFVTFEDVLEILEEDGDDVHTLESVLDELDELGIELRQEEAGREEVEENEEEFDSDKNEEIQDPGIGDINAVSADDPVGLYFRQMAQEPLLTAKEEVDLAKRIELGKDSYEKLPAVRRSERALRTELQTLVEDGQAAREHLMASDTNNEFATLSEQEEGCSKQLVAC